MLCYEEYCVKFRYLRPATYKRTRLNRIIYDVMKKWLFIVLILLTCSAYGQAPQLATANYAENGELIGLANLSGLEACTAANLKGKVKEINVDEPLAKFELRMKRESHTIQINLEMLSARNRATVFRDLIKKGRTLRVSGYRCGADEFIRAISIDRSY